MTHNFGDTSEFSHPMFTDADLPAIKQKLSQAFAAMEQAMKIVEGTKNKNISGMRRQVATARNQVLIILNSFEHRF